MGSNQRRSQHQHDQLEPPKLRQECLRKDSSEIVDCCDHQSKINFGLFADHADKKTACYTSQTICQDCASAE